MRPSSGNTEHRMTHRLRAVPVLVLSTPTKEETMASADVKITLTPSEFDLVREALKFTASNETEVALDASTDFKLRNEARTKVARLKDLIQRLNA